MPYAARLVYSVRLHDIPRKRAAWTESTEHKGALVGIFLVATLLVSVVLERRTRKRFKNHEKTEDDWSFFDDEASK